MIKVNSVTKTFGDKKAVDDVTFQVKDGEIFGFLGPNGAGKTTMIKMIVGLLLPDSGRIEVAGYDVVKDSLKSKEQLSYIPDNPDIYENMTGIQYLNFLADIYGVSQELRKERVEKYADLFELKEDLGGLISTYSHGMQQKLVIIGALIHDPQVMILDEPMVGLDPKSSFNLKEIMRQRCDLGKSVFFSTHVMEVAEKICDRIAIINHGQIIAVGTMEEIRNLAHDEGSLEKIFLELTE